MKKLFKNKKLWIALGLLITLTACTNVIDPETKLIMPDKIIHLDTTIGDILANESWFSAFFVYPISQAINFINQYVGVVMSIVIVTILIKLLTLSFTIKSTVASQKMQIINPELKAIQDKYAGKTDNQSKMKMSQEMQALYSKHNINPFGSIVVMFIQFPIIIAMYQAVQRAAAVVNGSVFGTSLQTTPMDAFFQGVYLFVVIYVLMGVFQFISMKLPMFLQKKFAPVKEKKHVTHDDSKKSAAPNMEMMMYVSLVMIMGIAISWPTAMSLYWLVTSLAQVAQTVFIQFKYISPSVGK
jgi:YidC/Oxa1 family membrane protein insertase